MSTRYLTPPEVAKRYGVNASKVLGFIHSGELRAVNVAASTLGRARWRISPSDIAVFEQRRSAVAPPKTRPRRKSVGIIEFF